jgi:hypothetical protein
MYSPSLRQYHRCVLSSPPQTARLSHPGRQVVRDQRRNTKPRLTTAEHGQAHLALMAAVVAPGLLRGSSTPRPQPETHRGTDATVLEGADLCSADTVVSLWQHRRAIARLPAQQNCAIAPRRGNS